MKKIIGIMLIALMAISIMSCAKEETAVASGPLTLAIWDNNQEPGLRKIIDDFTAETGVEVEIQVTPWAQYWTMLEAGATGGSLPDVFWMHSNQFATYAKYDILLDQTDLINSSDLVDLSKFPEGIVGLYNWEGKQFSTPKDMDTVALWYNKTMFDEAGVAYPDDTWTWDTFRAAAEKLTKDDGSQYAYAQSTDEIAVNCVVYTMGGEIISEDKKTSGFDNPNTIKAMKFLGDMSVDGLMPPYEVLAENADTALFEAGKVAMIAVGSWHVPRLCNNEYVIEHGDLAVLPKDPTTGRRVSIYNGLGYAIDKNTDQADEAWKLIEYLASEEGQQKQSDLGVVISAYEGTTANWINAYPDFNLQAYLDMMDDIVFRPYSENTVVWENSNTQKLIDIWTGKRSAEEVCAEIYTTMNDFLAKE